MINDIKKFLFDNSIVVPEEWIPACLDFVRSEYGSPFMRNVSLVIEKVYEQWLHSDLTELATSCLPYGIDKQIYTRLNGQFALQVNLIKDVGFPAYSQLRELRKENSKNASVSAEVSFAAAWEPKPSRMLMLQLTDGTSVISAIEYSRIPSLSLALKPGTKILVKGVTECRRGILFLTKDNVIILGGEVDSLAVPNALENVLNKGLGLEETDHPFKVSCSSFNLSHDFPSQNLNSSLTDDLINNNSNNMENKRTITSGNRNSSYENSNSRICTSALKAEAKDEFDDDFSDLFNDEAELELLEMKSQLASNNKYVKSAYNQHTNFLKNDNHQLLAQSSKVTISRTNDDKLFSNNSTMPIFPNRDHITKSEHPKEIVTSSDSLMPKSTSKNWGSNDASFEVDDEDLLLAAEMTSSDNMPRCNESVIQCSSIKSAAIVDIESRPLGNAFDQRNNSQLYNEGGSKDIPFEKKTFPSGPFIQKSEGGNPRELLPSTGNWEEGIKCESDDNFPPFQYLSTIDLQSRGKRYYIIKGFIITLLSRLAQVAGKWHLMATINDGTRACDVLIDDQVLRHLIGLSTAEYQAKKEEAKHDFQLKKALAQCLVGCQKELITLCSLLKLEVGSHLQQPIVVEIIPLMPLHLQQLKARMSS